MERVAVIDFLVLVATIVVAVAEVVILVVKNKII